MCGLVGMAGFLEGKHRNVMKDMLFLNTLRGKDSTGLSCVDRRKMVTTRKMTIPGYEFIEYPIVDRAMCHADQIWMGHGRFKTTGAVSKQNAHPFEVHDDEDYVLLVGTHNGTLQNKWEIEQLLKDKKFDTDSECLFNWMVEAPNYKEAIAKAKGAWSLVWWDPTTDCLHFLRNEERPLTYAFTKDFKVVLWASEAWMIINAAKRNGVELAQNERGLSCASTLVDTLYTLEIPQERDKALPEFKREGGHVGKPTQTFQDNGRRWNEWFRENDEERKKARSSGTKETTTVGAPPKQDVIIGIPHEHKKQKGITGFEGALLSLDEFKKIRDKGCGWCGDKMHEGTVFSFLNEERLVCVNCMRDSHDKGGVGDEDAPFLDDDLPFHLTDKGAAAQADSPEYKKVIADAAKRVVG